MISERDKILIEYRDTMMEMRGISPKLSIYKTLEAKSKDLLKRLGGEAEIKKVSKQISAVQKVVRNQKALPPPPEPIILLANGQPKCIVIDCVMPRQKKHTEKGHKQRYYRRCKIHRKELRIPEDQ